MLCGTFKKKRRHPGDEYRLVRSNTMPRIVSAMGRDVAVPVRRTKSTRVAARPTLIKDLLHMVRRREVIPAQGSEWNADGGDIAESPHAFGCTRKRGVLRAEGA